MYGSEVIPCFDEVGGEGVSEGVGRDALADTSGACGARDGAAVGFWMDVVAADDACGGIGGFVFGGEEPEPDPAFCGFGRFACHGIGERYSVCFRCSILFIEFAAMEDLFFEIRNERGGNYGDAVTIALGLTDGELLAFEVDVFDADIEKLCDSEACAVLQLGFKFVFGFEFLDESEEFGLREHGWDMAGAFAHFDPQIDFFHVADLFEEEGEGVQCLFLG